MFVDANAPMRQGLPGLVPSSVRAIVSSRTYSTVLAVASAMSTDVPKSTSTEWYSSPQMSLPTLGESSQRDSVMSAGPAMVVPTLFFSVTLTVLGSVGVPVPRSSATLVRTYRYLVVPVTRANVCFARLTVLDDLSGRTPEYVVRYGSVSSDSVEATLWKKRIAGRPCCLTSRAVGTPKLVPNEVSFFAVYRSQSRKV